MQVARLILSSRNTYKINKQSAKKCSILSEKSEPILVGTSKEFSPNDYYVIVNTETNKLINVIGQVGNPQDDLNIYNYLFTYKWAPNSKLNTWFKSYNYDQDICSSRIVYAYQVITVDPLGSRDLDDGFSLNYNEQTNIFNLSIHIADPTSYFDFANENIYNIIGEFANRLTTCYIPLDNKIKNLLPESFVQASTLIGLNKRAITFCFEINIQTNQVAFEIKHTILTNIINRTYESYDLEINKAFEYKNQLVKLANFMIKHMGCNLDLLSEQTDISHKLIEVFMIWTNFYAGNHIYMKYNKMFVRVQDKKIIESNQITESNTYIKSFLSYGANYLYVNAYTEEQNYAHASLGIENYCHITSPMRRLIDMLNHLIIHNINQDIYDRIISLINMDEINSQLRKYKKISSAYELINHLNITNKFIAYVFTLFANNKTALLVLYDRTNNFKKIIKAEIPIEYQNQIETNMEFNVELYYNPHAFTSEWFPFSIKFID